MGASTPPVDHGDSATRSSLAPGITIGRFQLLQKIGQGGMGAVFLARDPKLKRSVAIKLLTRREDHTGKRIARFKREARALAKLNHPGIVAVHEFGEHDGQHFLVMDLVKGRTFAQVLRQEDLPHRRIVELVRDVALALDHAHSAGIIHRDVKPENILISSDGLALLTDFGLAHDETAQEQLTKTGEILGTPHFMTPEQVSREMGEVGPWTDIHALGATLHEGLAGTPPFHATNVMALLRQVLKEDARPLHKIDPTIPRDVSVIVLKCLEKSPECRYPDASALADDLQRFLADEVVLAQSHGIVAKTIRRIARHRLLSAILLLTVLSATYSGLSSPESGQKMARQEQLSDLLKERKERRRAAIRQRADTVARDEAESDHRQAEQEDALRMALARTRFIDNLVNLGLVGDYLNRPTAKLGEIAFVRLPPNVTEEDIAHLAKLGQLHNLDFSGASIADAWLAHIQELTKLRDVNLGGTGITNSGVFYLAKLVQLTYLNLSKNPLTDSALQHIEAMTKLENLNLEKTRIGDEGLPHVGSLVKLKILHLSQTRVGDSALGSLQGMQRLEKLYLNDTRVTSLGLKNLAALPALQKLFLQNTMVDDSGLEMLKNARRLEHLSLIGTQVTAEAVQKLQRELPTCEIHFR